MLNDKEFGEDAVREELVVPLLSALGYSASPPYRIIRSRKLDHPFVQFGTVKKGITIIPDYLMERDGELAWVLDAKGPAENIDTGKNVEQAYSYAMHRDIKVPIYALCNGRKLIVSHVQYEKPIFDVPLSEINSVWTELLTLLGCKSAWPSGIRPDFCFDLGIALTKAGFDALKSGGKVMHMFAGLSIMSIGRPRDGLYTLSTPVESVALLDGIDEGAKYLISFDFDELRYQQLLSALDEALREQVKTALSRQPYSIHFKGSLSSPVITIAARWASRSTQTRMRATDLFPWTNSFSPGCGAAYQ